MMLSICNHWENANQNYHLKRNKTRTIEGLEGKALYHFQYWGKYRKSEVKAKASHLIQQPSLQ